MAPSEAAGTGRHLAGERYASEMPEVQRILDAIFAISSDLELPAVLQRIEEIMAATAPVAGPSPEAMPEA